MLIIKSNEKLAPFKKKEKSSRVSAVTHVSMFTSIVPNNRAYLGMTIDIR